MPFTISHPAIVLPLALLPKRYFSLTGLIAGSMAPDFEYFLRLKLQSDYSHTLEGIFYFNLPLTIILAFLFHNLVRNSLINNIPNFLSQRFSSYIDFDWNTYLKRKWLVVITSIIIGSFSHLFWDSFTHFGGYSVNIFSVLNETISIFSYEVAMLKILQHCSTLLGVLIIGIVILRIKPQKHFQPNTNKIYWLILSFVTLLVLGIRFLTGLNVNEYGNIIVSIISGILLGLLITPLILSYTFRDFKI